MTNGQAKPHNTPTSANRTTSRWLACRECYSKPVPGHATRTGVCGQVMIPVGGHHRIGGPRIRTGGSPRPSPVRGDPVGLTRDAEFVAFGIGQHGEPVVPGQGSRSQPDQPPHLDSEIVGTQIEMNAVLGHLGLEVI